MTNPIRENGFNPQAPRERPELVPWVRQFTGTPREFRAYVVAYDSRILHGCPHTHRSERTAQRCAERMTRADEKAERRAHG